MATIKAEPFHWHDRLADLAIEVFVGISSRVGYLAASTIGEALAKLQVIEDGDEAICLNCKWEHTEVEDISPCDSCKWQARDNFELKEE